MPYPSYQDVMKSIAFNRHYNYSKKYPLESSIFMTPKEIFQYHKLKTFDDYVCTGFFIFNVKVSKTFAEIIIFLFVKKYKFF